MLQINVQWDDAELIRRFARTETQFGFGIVKAVNKAAEGLQKAEHQRVRERFVIRKPEFFFGSPQRPGGVAARIEHFAKMPGGKKLPQGRIYAEVAVGASSLSANRRTLLALFEEGGERAPFTPGAVHTAVPITGRPARPAFGRGVDPRFTFANLKFIGTRRGVRLVTKKRRRGTVMDTLFGEFGRLQQKQLTLRDVQWKGRENTFILRNKATGDPLGVFQRFGKASGDIRMIWAFIKPFPNLDTRLHWLDLARELGPQLLHDAMQDQASDIIIHNAGRPA